MSLFKQKNSKYWWFEFHFNGERVRESTKTSNKRAAEQIEASHRTALAKGEAGIVDKPVIPTFKEFAPRFEAAISTLCKDKPRTIAFYGERMRRLLEYEPVASAKLDAIDEEVIEGLKRKRSRQVSRLGKPLSVASINRELATLRRLMRLAQEWKVIDRVPRIRLFRGEENREFVLNYQLEEWYLHMAPQPLKDIALLMLDTGMRPGEACAVEWKHVRLNPAAGAKFGYVHVPGGKSKNAKRNLSLTARVAAMLKQRKESARDAALVFPGDAAGPFLVSSIDHQHTEFRALLGLPKEFVIHSLRHTMLTRLGESGADAFTIMRIAGHSSVTVSQRYVHPSPESLERAFERMDSLNSAKRGEKSGVPIELPIATKSVSGENQLKPFVVNKMGA